VQQGKNTVIGIGSQQLAGLSNVKANQITTDDFVTVDFTQLKEMEVPTLVAAFRRSDRTLAPPQGNHARLSPN
jgi:hypothetical protein